jgi:hypothetical protein
MAFQFATQNGVNVFVGLEGGCRESNSVGTFFSGAVGEGNGATKSLDSFEATCGPIVDAANQEMAQEHFYYYAQFCRTAMEVRRLVDLGCEDRGSYLQLLAEGVSFM